MRRTCLLVFLAGATASAALAAQPDRDDAEAPAALADEPITAESFGQPRFLFGKPGSVSANAEARVQWTMPGDLDDGAGEVGIFRTAGEIGVSIPLSERSLLSFSVADEVSIYDFKDFSFMGDEVNPIDEGNELSISSRYLHVFNDRWSMIVGGGVAWSAEFDADWQDAITGRVFGAAQYSISRRLSVGIGGLFATQLEDDALIIPIALIEWRPTDELTISNTAGSGGAGLQVAYEFAEHWTASLEGSFQRREYRLSDDNAFAEGVFRDTRVPVSLGVRYEPSANLLIELRAGANVYTDFEIFDGAGDEAFSSEADPTGFIGLRVRLAQL